MKPRIEFAEVYKVDGYGLLVHFSDGSQAIYTVDELLNARPHREPLEKVPEVSPRDLPFLR